MFLRRIFPVVLLLLAALPSAAGEFVLPVFALNLDGRHGDRWSSELYLTNPGDQPVLVELTRFLPGNIERATPCDLFMTPTRVVPPQSATVWTAAGLATDLGCADSARGGLVLRADGPLHVTSRLVNLGKDENGNTGAVLSGRGEAFDATPIDQLPQAGAHLLPALMWHRNPCENAADFETVIGFANPGAEPVEVVLDVPHEFGRSVILDGREAFLPYRFEVAGGSWQQYKLAPVRDASADCGGVESFLVRLDLSGSVAVYASVIDRKSGDPRTVTTVPLTTP
ncbi:MAG: hypothetical protein QNL88_02995 [Acidobacteriota bacterium]|nr:hypothetical protein [Acidobacteriota bacterium]